VSVIGSADILALMRDRIGKQRGVDAAAVDLDVALTPAFVACVRRCSAREFGGNFRARKLLFVGATADPVRRWHASVCVG
jgi:hypothetical protein